MPDESFDDGSENSDPEYKRDHEAFDEGVGDDFDDFEAGDEADDFGDFDDGFEQPSIESESTRPEPPPMMKTPYVSSSEYTTPIHRTCPRFIHPSLSKYLAIAKTR